MRKYYLDVLFSYRIISWVGVKEMCIVPVGKFRLWAEQHPGSTRWSDRHCNQLYGTFQGQEAKLLGCSW